MDENRETPEATEDLELSEDEASGVVGGDTGKVSVTPFTITKKIDVSSPTLSG